MTHHNKCWQKPVGKYFFPKLEEQKDKRNWEYTEWNVLKQIYDCN